MSERIYVRVMTVFFVLILLTLSCGCASKPYHYRSNWQYSGQYGSQDLGRGQY